MEKNVIAEKKEVVDGVERTVKVIKPGARTTSEKPIKDEKKRTTKVSNEKAKLNDVLLSLLKEKCGNVYLLKNSTWLFEYEGKEFTLKMCESRKSKKNEVIETL